MAPVFHALSESKHLDPLVAVTAQHREMLDMVVELFGIQIDFDLDIIRPEQTPTDVTVRALPRLESLYLSASPDVVMVQGDTTSALVGALASYYCQIPVVHLEAGLRSGNPYDPFPEEINRRLITELAHLHLAPTASAKDNLTSEGIRSDTVVVTGNTVIDALLWSLDQGRPPLPPEVEGALAGCKRVILATSHRRESWGEALRAVCRAIAEVTRRFSDVGFLLPVHPNPRVKTIVGEELGMADRVLLVDPLPYDVLSYVLKECHLVVTDSGGIQEEAPTLGKPVLVVRNTTERPEGVLAGNANLVGTTTEAIVHETTILLEDATAYARMARAINPYGDGKAAARVHEALVQFCGRK